MHKINKCVSVNLHMIPTAMRKLNKPLQQAIHKHAPNTLYQQKLKKPEQAKGQGNEWKLWNHSKQQQLKQAATCKLYQASCSNVKGGFQFTI